MLVSCTSCGVEFDKHEREIKRSKSGNHFCSRSCSAKINNLGVSRYKKKEKNSLIVKKTCIWHCCGKQFLQDPEKSKKDFCSPSCKRSYYVQRNRFKVKLLAVNYKGGRCEKCGYDKCIDSFDFHHKNPSEKEFGIGSKGVTRSWEKTRKEIDKCILLCANCHREEHYNLKVTKYIYESLKENDEGGV